MWYLCFTGMFKIPKLENLGFLWIPRTKNAFWLLVALALQQKILPFDTLGTSTQPHISCHLYKHLLFCWFKNTGAVTVLIPYDSGFVWCSRRCLNHSDCEAFAAGRWNWFNKHIWWTICRWKLQIKTQWTRNTVYGKHSILMYACVS